MQSEALMKRLAEKRQKNKNSPGNQGETLNLSTTNFLNQYDAQKAESNGEVLPQKEAKSQFIRLNSCNPLDEEEEAKQGQEEDIDGLEIKIEAKKMQRRLTVPKPRPSLYDSPDQRKKQTQRPIMV